MLNSEKPNEDGQVYDAIMQRRNQAFLDAERVRKNEELYTHKKYEEAIRKAHEDYENAVAEVMGEPKGRYKLAYMYGDEWAGVHEFYAPSDEKAIAFARSYCRNYSGSIWDVGLIKIIDNDTIWRE